MPPSVENTAACGYPQDPRYDDMADYDMTYDHPPPHGHHDRDVPDYTGVAQNDFTEAQVNQPANVCTVLSFPYTISNETLHQRAPTHSTTQVSTLQLVLLKPSSMNGFNRTLFLMGKPLNISRGSRFTTCTSQIYKFPLFIWNLVILVVPRWSSPSKWPASELDSYKIVLFLSYTVSKCSHMLHTFLAFDLVLVYCRLLTSVDFLVLVLPLSSSERPSPGEFNAVIRV
jgi:hypothetical protein